MLRGLVRIWCGPIIVAELPMAVPVLPASVEATASRAAPVPEPAVRRYRKIFPSYSRRDGEMVQYFVTAAHALGDQYLQDVLSVRPGERWNDRLLELIEEADVFQLFWSYNSMRSPYCRLEWERALALRRPSFVRPVYWEDPLPADPQAGLPPEELRALQFAHVPHFVTRELARPEPPVYGAPAARPSAGRPPAGATPAQDAPRPEAPRYELPGAAASRVEVPRLEAPRLEAPRLEVPRLEAPRVEAPRAGSSRRSLRLALVLLLLLAISAAVVLYVRSR